MSKLEEIVLSMYSGYKEHITAVPIHSDKHIRTTSVHKMFGVLSQRLDHLILTCLVGVESITGSMSTTAARRRESDEPDHELHKLYRS